MKITESEVKEKFLETVWTKMKEEDHVDEDDKEIVVAGIESVIQKQGGWKQVHEEVLTGIKNGYTIEKQFEIMLSIL